MASKEIALSLSQVCRKSSSAVSVEVAKRCRECWACNARRDAEGDDSAPSTLARNQILSEGWIDQQVGQVGIAHVRSLDGIQKFCADDAAALPNTSTLAEIDAPVEVVGGSLD